MFEELSLYCPNCSKKYSRQKYYDKHILFCHKQEGINMELLNSTEEETIETCRSPSLILQVVQELVKSNNILKTEIAELKKQNQKQSRKIPILDLLNKNFIPNQDYDALDQEVTSDDLEIVFEHNLIEGIQEIFKRQLSDSSENNPIKAFDQKNNILYGYKDKKWNIITLDNFNKIILKITKDILSQFKQWQDEHEHEIYSENLSVIYLANLKKVIGGNMDQDKLNKKFYNNLYQYLKKNLSSIEYEII